jgi:hypothetical protein
MGDIRSLRIFPCHVFKTPGKEGEHIVAKRNIPITWSRNPRAPTSLQPNVKIFTSNPIAITPPFPYPTDIDLQYVSHNNMPQVTGHSPPAPTSLHSTSSHCTNRPGNPNTQPKPTTTYRPQPHTRSRLRSMATQSDIISTSKYPAPCTHPHVGKHIPTPYMCHKHSNIADRTLYNNHTMLEDIPHNKGHRGTDRVSKLPSSP